MAWGFWSASTVSDRGRSPRRATTTTSSSTAMYYQPQQQQCVTMNQCVPPEEPPIPTMPMPVQQQQQKQGPMTSVCGSPCQSVCHTPTCHSPSCQSGTTGKRMIKLMRRVYWFHLITLFLSPTQIHPSRSNAPTSSVKSPNVNTYNNSSFCSSKSNFNSNSSRRHKCSKLNSSSIISIKSCRLSRTFTKFTTRTRGEHRWTAISSMLVAIAHFVLLLFFFVFNFHFVFFPYWFSILFAFTNAVFALLQTNQLTDIICRAVQPSIQSASNTLTRNSSLHGDTGDYAIPQPHPHHHIITTTKSTTSLIRCGSCPGSTGVSRRGSSSESSPAGTVGHASIHGSSIHGGSIHGGSMHGGSMHGGSMHGGSMHGGSDGTSVIGQGYYTDTAHYDRMPIPIPIVPAPPHHSNMHSEDEIEPAYATVFPNPTANIQLPPQHMNYQVEDRSIYRRGARRWRKLYRINGHIFQAKRFNRVSL